MPATSLRPLLGVSLIALLALGSFGCQQKAASTDESTTQSGRSIYDHGEVPTTEQAQAFGEALQMALAEEPGRVGEMVDLRLLLNVATADTGVPRKFRDDFNRGALSTNAFADLGTQWAAIIQNGGSVEFVGVREREGEQRVLLRVLPAEGGFNYVEFALVRRNDQVKAGDAYMYLTGEKTSETFRRLFLMAAAGHSDNILQRLTGSESTFIKHADKYKSLSQAAQTGQWQLVLDTYDQLPPEMQAEKTVMIFRMLALAEVDEQRYVQAIQEFREAFPNDASADLHAIDLFVLREEYDQALESVNRLDETVDDPYLDILRSNIYLARENLPKARELSQKATQTVGYLEEPWWNLLAISLQEKQFEETVRMLNVLEDQFGYEFDLTTAPEYAEFLKTPQYRQWKAGD